MKTPRSFEQLGLVPLGVRGGGAVEEDGRPTEEGQLRLLARGGLDSIEGGIKAGTVDRFGVDADKLVARVMYKPRIFEQKSSRDGERGSVVVSGWIWDLTEEGIESNPGWPCQTLALTAAVVGTPSVMVGYPAVLS